MLLIQTKIVANLKEQTTVMTILKTVTYDIDTEK